MGRKKIKPEIDSGEMRGNPFAVPLVVRVRKGFNKRIKHGKEVKEVWEAEYDPYTKVFEIKGYKVRMQGLSIRGKEMLLYLIHSIEGGKDWIWINRHDYMKNNGIGSVNTFKKSLKELCDGLYISPVQNMQDVFWINPQIFFKGNRIAKFRDNVREMNTLEEAANFDVQ